MRLGQLSRKLDITPAEIIQFLAAKNVTVDSDVNTKLNEDSVRLALEHFAPGSIKEFVKVETDASPQQEIDAPPVAVEKADDDEFKKDVQPTEVIKAPKIELAGLKVVGKIDLPDKKKKEETDVKPEGEPKPDKAKRVDRTPKRPRPNPIALQRQKEAAEAARKLEEERRIEKERRTQNYLKKVKTAQPTKAAKIIKEQTEVLAAEELVEPPKGWFKKFLKWLTT